MPAHLTPRELEAAEKLRAVRAEIRSLEAEASVLRDDLLAALDGESFGVTASGDIAVQVRTQTRTGLDTQKVRALFPEVWLQCRKDTEVTVVLVPTPTRTRRDRAREAAHPAGSELEIPPVPDPESWS